MWLKRLRYGVPVACGMMLLFLFYCNKKIVSNAKGRLFNNEKEIPYQKTGLLLGTGKYLSNGKGNPYYFYRIAAAEKLFAAGKIKYLIISGDNSRKDYDEPAWMREDLIKAGIDSSRLFVDDAGFRTFDSVKRLHKIFGVDSVTFISQPFHNERALYLADQEKMVALGFNARDVNDKQGFKTRIREELARCKVFLDIWLGTQPKFLGHPIQIPAS